MVVPFLFTFLLALSVFGVFSMYNPERAHRYENPLQIRDVELTEAGVAVQVLGGLFVVLVAGWFALVFSTRHWLYPVSYLVVVLGSYLLFRGNGLGASSG